MLIFSVLSLSAQSDTIVIGPRYGIDIKKRFSIMAAYQLGRSHYATLGVAMNRYGRIGYHPVAGACYASLEYQLHSKPVLGPTIGAYIGGGASALGLGINLSAYTDRKRVAWSIRPEIGLAIDRFKILYGYNFILNNKDMTELNRHQLAVGWLFGIIKRRGIRLE